MSTGTGQPRLVALRALGLGDLLTGLPALRALSRAFPEHRRLLAAPAALEPLLALSECGFQLVPTSRLEPLRASLAASEVAVNLHGRGPQSHRLLLATRPGRLMAFSHPDVPETEGSPIWRAGEHEVARWCRLLEESAIPADPHDLRLEPPPGTPPDQGSDAPVLMHPGAASPARRWPADNWAALARHLVAAGRPVVLTGSSAEAPLAARIARAAGLPPRAVLAGRTDLRALSEAVARAALVVCGDTGVAHLATALATPSVLLFGPTSPAHWGPLPGLEGGQHHRVLWKGTTGDPHANRPDPGLVRIRVEEVVAAIDAERSLRTPAGLGGGGR